MENLPKNVADEWAKWCRSRDYLFAGLSHNNLFFERITCAITSISIDDDFFAPKQAVEWLTAKFARADVKRLHLVPESFNVSAIGHFSLFKEKFRNTIWDMLLKEATRYKE